MIATLRLLLQAARAWLPASGANVGIIHAFALGDQLALRPLCKPLGSNRVNNYAKRFWGWVNEFRGCWGGLDAVNIWPSCFRHPRDFMVFKAPGRTVHAAQRLLDFGTRTCTWRGEKGTASHLQRRDVKGEGEKRDQKSESSSRRQEEERRQENKTAPKTALPFAALQTKNSHLESFFFASGRGCKLCSKRCRGVPGEPSPWLSQAKQLPLHTRSGPCGAAFDQKRSKFLLRWSLGRQSPIFSQFCRFFFPSWLVGVK